MSPLAIRLLKFHKSNSNRATFALTEMSMEGHTLGEIDAAYAELQQAGYVEPSGNFTAVNPAISRSCFRITQTGADAVPTSGQ